MLMVGDVLIHGVIYEESYDSKTNTFDFKPSFEEIKPIASKYDLAFYNQETILGGIDLGLGGSMIFNSPYEVGDAMVDAGFDIVSTATNHSFDKGEQAIINSTKYWNKQKNIIMSGTKTNKNGSDVKIFEKNGIKFAYVAYTKGINKNVLPEGKEYLVNIFNREKAKKDIDSVRNKVDFVIVSMHWGQDMGYYPNSKPEPWENYKDGTNPKELANYLSTLGVDLIIGHHPHVIHPIEKVNNTLVFYSLGNFISDQNTNDDYNKVIGLMSSVEFTKQTYNGKNVYLSLKNTNNLLSYSYEDDNIHKVIPYTSVNEKICKEYIRLGIKNNKILRLYDESVPVTEYN